MLGVSDLLDPYQKIKLNANLCMRNLFKNNSKVLFNYWFIMFPQFMLRSVPDITSLVEQLEQLDEAHNEKNYQQLI